MGKFEVLDHPLIQHKLTMIRDKNVGTKFFRETVKEISTLMAYEVARDMPLKNVEIETPIAKTTQKELAGKKVAIIPILRAGIGMVDGMTDLIPAAKIGFIGMYRDEETLKPHEYFVKLPNDITERQLFIVDPMLATGGSAMLAIEALKKRGCSEKNMKFACLVAAPEGVKAVRDAYPDVDIYTAGLDDHLNEDGYIVPGLGDAGDRLFGTK
ncbi:uracil phosphoribosyltransferase [Limosilactobacillus reuteri]|uniref:Uracil phosphoribosyltransferase n=1 Tax=Limosilactobacillus reuteri TaxID=1598 RepID=A0A317GIC8_LIMRT|nr:uracil phosphoribosyltransferase [Limosilactobacillus reuteri]MCH5385852.1 uracil phosphoribosyltransferase [Limosilactobacillus reuteri]PWT49239.1 uracil phosphoribosyltransferase [Limosilactobacillus reuteri]PWT54056.1 uracil phosphoribosyltransferase [Limosilactobacillus reuteri]PWT64553.1 uracil phosphoribosyltransferase [Limosilactobacillus reuteri]